MEMEREWSSQKYVMEILGHVGQMLDCGAMLDSQRKWRRRARSEGLFEYQNWCTAIVVR